jgi:protein-S-isoprenylcysteine O-methyltransferase Ste14
MDNELLFRIVLAVKGVAYIVPRFYYRRQAVRANPSGETELRDVRESKLRLALMAVSGLGANLLTLLWIVNPAWLSWSRLPLPDGLRWVGIVLGAIAVWSGYLAHRTLGVNYTATLKRREEQRLVIQGVYRWVRHPMYSSFFAVLATDFLLTANWLVGLLGVVYSLVIIERAGHEERILLESFGEEYRQYTLRTGRFFPRLVRRKAGLES